MKKNNYTIDLRAKRRSSSKMITVLCISSMLFTGFGNTHYTESYFTDIEWTNNNEYQASVLDIDLIAGDDFDAETGSCKKLTWKKEQTRDIKVINNGTLDFSYDIFLTPYDKICEKMDLSVTRNGYDIYEGELIDFNLFNVYLDVTGEDDFIFTVSANRMIMHLASCNFDLDFKAEQIIEVNNGFGFSDSAMLENKAGTDIIESLKTFSVKVADKVEEEQEKTEPEESTSIEGEKEEKDEEVEEDLDLEHEEPAQTEPGDIEQKEEETERDKEEPSQEDGTSEEPMLEEEAPVVEDPVVEEEAPAEETAEPAPEPELQEKLSPEPEQQAEPEPQPEPQPEPTPEPVE